MKIVAARQNTNKETGISCSVLNRFWGFGSRAICFVLMSILFQGCAKIGAPTGGIKDTTPPKYIRGVPENRSTGFSSKEINFWFDEYIQLKDLNKELVVSPPLKVRPNVRIKDKSIRINLMNELLPATTYTINFGNSLSDLNEGNLLPDFEFVFSTGDKVDSLAITGRALNAFDHNPLKDAQILVGLYEDLSDSAPLLHIPHYIGRASTNGLFSINNIHPDTCRIIAINDINGNMKYDPGSESVAFLDTFLIINAARVKPQTFIKDTIKVKKLLRKGEGSAKQAPVKSLPDSNIVQGKKLNALNVNLYYFLEETDKVYVTGKKRDTPEKLFLSFSRSPHDSVRILPLNYKPGTAWFVKEANTKGDSLTYWIMDSLMAKRDTLSMALSYTSTDSSGNFILRTDTIIFKYQKTTEKTSGKKARANAAKMTAKKLTVTASIGSKGMQNLNKPVVFVTDKPISIIDPDSIEFYKTEDSVNTSQLFTCIKDKRSLRKFMLTTEWKESTHYHILLKPGAIKDIYGLENDSLEIKFTTQKSEYYGRIIVKVGSNHFPIILQVMDQKGRIVDAKNLKQPERVIFDYLPPDKYTLKAIVDNNQNGIWDTGNYLKHRQPEPVFFYKMLIELRSNWDNEMNWEIPD